MAYQFTTQRNTFALPPPYTKYFTFGADKYSTYTSAEHPTAFIPCALNSAWETTTAYRGSTGTGGHGSVFKSPCAVTGSALTTGGRSLSATQGGFNALLTGLIGNGAVVNYRYNTYYWMASAYGSNQAWCRTLFREELRMDRSTTNRNSLYAIRCKKD